jgi:hypothetical protein
MFTVLEGKAVAKTVKHYQVSINADFADDAQITLFDNKYFVEYIAINQTWTSKDSTNFYSPVEILYTSILASGKRGQKSERRSFDFADLGKYTDLPTDFIDTFKAKFEAKVVEAIAAGN